MEYLWKWGIPFKGSIAVTKHHNPMQRKEEKNLFQVTVPNHSSSFKEVRAGTQEQNEHEGKN